MIPHEDPRCQDCAGCPISDNTREALSNVAPSTIEALKHIEKEDVEAMKDTAAFRRVSKAIGLSMGAIILLLGGWLYDLSGEVTTLKSRAEVRESKLTMLDTRVDRIDRDAAENFRLDASQQQVLLNLTSQLARIEEKLDRVIETRDKK